MVRIDGLKPVHIVFLVLLLEK